MSNIFNELLAMTQNEVILYCEQLIATGRLYTMSAEEFLNETGWKLEQAFALLPPNYK